MKPATIEGLESSWDSPGLGEKPCSIAHEPIVGERFAVLSPDGSHVILDTSVVQSVRRLGATTIGFRTQFSTYVLRVQEDA